VPMAAAQKLAAAAIPSPRSSRRDCAPGVGIASLNRRCRSIPTGTGRAKIGPSLKFDLANTIAAAARRRAINGASAGRGTGLARRSRRWSQPDPWFQYCL